MREVFCFEFGVGLNGSNGVDGGRMRKKDLGRSCRASQDLVGPERFHFMEGNFRRTR